MSRSEYQKLREDYVERTKRRISDLEPVIENLTESSRWNPTEEESKLDNLFQKIEFWKLQIMKELKSLEQISLDPWSWTFKIDDIEHLWVRIQTCLNQALDLLGFEDKLSQRSLAPMETASIY